MIGREEYFALDLSFLFEVKYHTDGEKVITVNAFLPFFRAYKSPLFGIDTM